VPVLYTDHGAGGDLLPSKGEAGMNTRDRILHIAIDLFAEKGYDAVSMREIAAAVGIKAASLYKHYTGKEEILECVFDTYREMMERSNEFDESFLAEVEVLSLRDFLTASFQAFKDMILSPEMLKITRIITMEQTRNASVRDFFYTEMIEKPIAQLTELFTQLQGLGLAGDKDPAMLAKTYHAYIIASYYTNNFLTAEPDMERIEADMLDFIGFFCDAVLTP
jgi:AcrR family transcriptional regulator